MNVVEAERSHDEELQDLQRPPRPEKVAEVERLEGVLKESASVFLTDFRGIDVAMMNDLRGRFREAEVQFRIVKNNLLIRAADRADLPDWVNDLEGPTAMAISLLDPVAPARVIKSFQDDHRRQGDFLIFKGGLLEGEIIEQSTFVKLASLPSRDELLGKLVWMLNSPLQGLVNVLTGVSRGLVTALEDLRKKRVSGEIAGLENEAAAPEETAGEPEEVKSEEADGDAETEAAAPEETAGEPEEVKSEEAGEEDEEADEKAAEASTGESDESEEGPEAGSEQDPDETTE